MILLVVIRLAVAIIMAAASSTDWVLAIGEADAYLLRTWGIPVGFLDKMSKSYRSRYSLWRLKDGPDPVQCVSCSYGFATTLCTASMCCNCCTCPQCRLFLYAALDTDMSTIAAEVAAGLPPGCSAADRLNATGRKLLETLRRHSNEPVLPQALALGVHVVHLLARVPYIEFRARVSGRSVPVDPGPEARNVLRGRPAPVAASTQPILVGTALSALVAAYRPVDDGPSRPRVVRLPTESSSEVYALAPLVPLWPGDGGGDSAHVETVRQNKTEHAFACSLLSWHEHGYVSHATAAAAAAAAAAGAPIGQQGWLIIDAPARTLIFRHTAHGRSLELCGCSPCIADVERWLDMPSMSHAGTYSQCAASVRLAPAAVHAPCPLRVRLMYLPSFSLPPYSRCRLLCRAVRRGLRRTQRRRSLAAALRPLGPSCGSTRQRRRRARR